MENMIFLQDMLAHIKEKKELSSLDDATILPLIKKHCSSFDFSKYSSFQQALRNKKIKESFRLIRSELRTMYGLFLHRPLHKTDLQKSGDVDSFLSLHRSTEERLSFYKEFYQKIFEVLDANGLPQEFSVLDIACGYNPLAVVYMPRPPTYYVASDLSSQDMDTIQSFFSSRSLQGKTFAASAISQEFQEEIKDSFFDVVFLFKALDSFESQERHSSKKLLASLSCSFLVVTFPLVSIGGKNAIDISKRSWFEQFCARQNWEFKTLFFSNEVCYIIACSSDKRCNY